MTASLNEAGNAEATFVRFSSGASSRRRLAAVEVSAVFEMTAPVGTSVSEAAQAHKSLLSEVESGRAFGRKLDTFGVQATGAQNRGYVDPEVSYASRRFQAQANLAYLDDH